MKSLGVAYTLLLLGGIWGAHKFYLGRPVMGLFYILTIGFLFVGILYDLFTLPGQVKRANAVGSRPGSVSEEELSGSKGFSDVGSEKEKIVLVMARNLKGRVTPIDIATDTFLSVEEASTILDKLVSQAYADMKVSESGLIVYEFPNFIDDERRSTGGLV